MTIHYQLTLIGPTVTVTHSDIDETLPLHSVRLTAGESELVVVSTEWIDRWGELDEYVLAWLLEHIDLHAARSRPGSRRYDEVWMRAWREANPVVS
ncbi:hypothetical protein [Brachybacterium sp. YJGR34]|uniref:hypothetical protein n=1 Tax=Brachybacterium sp. YJGR34 TaxID=2059911 RepID=UPI001E555A25|nr:hypothetical protein [Brachybacterium sp. YJGR34]